MDYRKKFVVKPGSRVRLARIDPASSGGFASRESAAPAARKQIERMDRLQYLLYADASQALLIVLQAPDAGGKDGVIRHIFSGMDPQGIAVFAFKEPSKIELAHDFTWRAHQHAPARGQVVIYNRSYYEDVLVTRVHKLVTRRVWLQRYELINSYERILTAEGTRILKFYLHISPVEQLDRFKKRLEDPTRHWKITEADYAERELWRQYRQAYEDAIERTSTAWAPWYVIPANHKWFRDLAVSTIVADTMDDMRLKFPQGQVDLSEIRRKYHAATRRSRRAAA